VCGSTIEIADARKVKAMAPLACKTDRVDARVRAQLSWRDLAARPDRPCPVSDLTSRG
jgi:transposase